MLGVRPIHQRSHARTDHDRNVQFAALGVDGVVLGMVGGNLGKEGINGRAAEAVVFDHELQLVDGVHALVRIKPGHADETFRVALKEGDDSPVAGSDAVGGFGVAAGDDALDHALRFHIAHDVLDGLGVGALVELEQCVHFPENGVINHPLHRGRDVRAEAEIDNVHGRSPFAKAPGLRLGSRLCLPFKQEGCHL